MGTERYRKGGETMAMTPVEDFGERRHARFVIVGTGFAGIGMAIRLRQRGIDDVLLLERADDFGGTWRDNAYPGCACDVPSHLYSFSFAQNPHWTRTFSPQREIYAYLRECADRHGLRRLTRFGHDVLEAAWDADAQRWEIETTGGAYTADVLLSGTGALSDAAIPDVPGLAEFTGRTFHSATWDHGYDLRGKRVAVIGTGASAIQFVPQIAPQVAELHLFQRTAPWIVPRRDRPITRVERALFRRSPAVQRAMRAAIYWGRESWVLGFRHPWIMRGVERAARVHLRRQVAGVELREKLTPRYRLGCKRVLISNDYLPSLDRPNVDVVTTPIDRVTATGVVDADGREREVDAIIFGTGFQIADLPFAHRLRGADGRTLAEHWGGSMRAHHGTMIAGFPNFFFLLGPNTGLGHTSVVYMIEAQIDRILVCLDQMEARGAAEIEVRAEAEHAFNEQVQRRMQGTVWTSGGCASWYLDDTGRNTTLWPDFTFRFRARAREVAPAEHDFRGPRPLAPVAEPVLGSAA